MVTGYRMKEALEKLNRGIEESKQLVQQQTMTLAQDFFGDSVEGLKQQIQENRATLEGLPDQIPGGQDESFQMLFQELMDNYEAIEQALDEANNNVSEIEPDRLVRQGEVDATDAARREARERGVDLTEVEGTGTDGRITVDDVRTHAESQQQDSGDAAEQVVNASDAARRRAEEMGVDLSQLEGTGSGGLVTVKDVTSAAGGAAQQAARTASQATNAVGQTVAQADGAVNQATQQAGSVAGGNGDEGPKATSAARRKAEDLGVDLSQIQGSGAGGLITIRDVVQT